MAHIACLLAPGFEDAEFRLPYDELTQRGFAVDVIGTEAFSQLEGLHREETVLVDKSIEEVSASQYDAVFIPGGYSPDLLRGDERFLAFVKAFDRLGRPLGVLGHGPQLLMSAGLVKGHTLTASKTVRGDLQLAQATVKDEAVVSDRHWTTCQKAADVAPFLEAFTQTLH